MALAILLVVAPVVEIYVMVQVANGVGVLEMLLLMVLLCVAGAWVLRVETFQSLRRVRTSIAEGRMPTAELLDALLVFIAGVLLVVPGFVTAALGLLLVLPPVRAVARRVLRRSVELGVGRRVRISGFSSTPGGRPGGAWGPGVRPPGPRQYWSPSSDGYGNPSAAGSASDSDSDFDDLDEIIDLEGEEIWLVDVRGEIEASPPVVDPDPSQEPGRR